MADIFKELLNFLKEGGNIWIVVFALLGASLFKFKDIYEDVRNGLNAICLIFLGVSMS